MPTTAQSAPPPSLAVSPTPSYSSSSASPPAWATAHCAATLGALRDARPAVEWPPPCPLPAEKRPAFERARMSIKDVRCAAQRYATGHVLDWPATYIDGYCAGIAAGREGGTYGLDVLAELRSGLREIVLDPVGAPNARGPAGATALVMGTEVPWVECLLLNEGVKSVVTFEYAAINVAHPRLSAAPCPVVAADYLAGTREPVDLIVSFSSLEHSGLGRYGDALDPDGDKAALAQAWCMLRPGGLLVLGLPMSCEAQGAIWFNLHRIYGYERLAYVAENFELVGFAGGACNKLGGSYTPLTAGDYQPAVVLRKPAVYAAAGGATLTAADFEEAGRRH